MRLDHRPYRLLFKHPFSTSHGTRTGTDTVFIRLKHAGRTGYGEVTLPPYLKESQAEVIQRLRELDRSILQDPETLGNALELPEHFPDHAPGFRCGVHMAWADLMAQRDEQPLHKWMGVAQRKQGKTLVTVGAGSSTGLHDLLIELPDSDLLKLKVAHEDDYDTILRVKSLDERMLFIDANQGLRTLGAVERLMAAGGQRLMALEQPFKVEELELQRRLQRELAIPVYGDESIQDLADLELAAGAFKGVNIKLVKCGGLDRALRMVERADEHGLEVMLGNMSESSLGCTAAAHLSGLANLIDLDGPLLISNDPFRGAELRNRKLRMPERAGIGAVPVQELDFQPV